ncbi:BTB/POZ domain-containing protein 3 [Aphelenchoides avenae]|nr:BTB/POZ domain-containing protein 3 [Aphelenchus avenae]
MSMRLEAPPEMHNNWLAKRFSDKKFADARFVVIEHGEHRREFLAHKLVLASVSDVFEAMFYGNFREEDPVRIEDTTAPAFEALLKFIYTGAVAVDSDSAFPLLYLAKKYLVGGLVSLVLHFLQSSVNESNVAQLVLHGQNYLDDAPETYVPRCL